jgi:hypothetical protein
MLGAIVAPSNEKACTEAGRNSIGQHTKKLNSLSGASRLMPMAGENNAKRGPKYGNPMHCRRLERIVPRFYFAFGFLF